MLTIFDKYSLCGAKEFGKTVHLVESFSTSLLTLWYIKMAIKKKGSSVDGTNPIAMRVDDDL